MGGKLTVATAGTDLRVKAAAPSCGGTSDRENANPLHGRTVGDAPALSALRSPIIFLFPANDFHGHIEHLPVAVEEISDTEWRVTCSPHLNHRDAPEYEVATQLWFDQHLKGSFTWPTTPRTTLDLETGDGVPRFTVQADPSREILAVDVYYTQQGKPGKEHRVNRINQFWHHATCTSAGDSRWEARLPVSSIEKPLWVYANVTYALDEPISGAGYYYGDYTTKTFNLSSLVELVGPEQLQAAGVKPGLEADLLIEDFEGDWRKEWFTYQPQDWSLRTHKIYHPLWAAPEGATLSIEVLSESPNQLVLGIDSHAAAVPLEGSPEWQTVTLSPSDLLDAGEQPLENWKTIGELRLLATEHLRGGPRDAPVTRQVGGAWQGAPPKFRNLRWVVDDEN